MSRKLAFAAVVLGVLLVSLALRRSPTPSTMQRSQVAAAPVTEPVKPTAKPELVEFNYRPATVTMPAPVVISTWLEAGSIKDPELRKFVRDKTNFREDRALYFEWLGCAGDTLTSENDSKKRKYTITLHSCSGEQNVTHRQVFIIPATYSFDVQIGNTSNE